MQKKSIKKTASKVRKAAQTKQKALKLLTKIRKRDRSLVKFDPLRIVDAVYKAMLASAEGSRKDAEHVARHVVKKLEEIARSDKTFTPFVEGVQDMVEQELMLEDFVKTAKGYILFRDKRAGLRGIRGDVSEEVRRLANESKKYFRNQLAEFVYYTTYSKWIPEAERRETWVETVDRYVDFMKENIGLII